MTTLRTELPKRAIDPLQIDLLFFLRMWAKTSCLQQLLNPNRAASLSQLN
jgi:hypothetical protein